MADRNVGAVLVVADEHLLGIFTERDAVFRVIAKGRDANTTQLTEVMQLTRKTLEPGKTYGHALLIMQETVSVMCLWWRMAARSASSRRAMRWTRT